MTVTLRDVAEHAGVSVRTVSNVVNEFRHVSPGMRERVQASIDVLGYRPNLVARSLRAGRSGIVLLLVPDVAAPYFGDLAHEVVELAGARGCTVMVDETGGRRERERALLDQAARSSWVDGVLLSSLGLTRRDLDGLADRPPVVLLGERTARTALDHVGIDDVAASREAVEHLLTTGRRRVVALGGRSSPDDATTRLRLRGYRAALDAAGLGEGRHAPTETYRRADAGPAVRAALDTTVGDRPDALFCFSDELAAGALRALHELGLRVPRDVAVVGFDDSDASRFLVPSLTSVRQHRDELARASLDLLLQRVGGLDGPPREVRVGYELVVRESSAPAGCTT